MSDTQVILLKNIPSQGPEGTVLKVRPGYAFNYLIPQGLACLVTKSSLKTLKHLEAKRAEREAQELVEAQTLAKRIQKMKMKFVLETGESGKAFGSITAKDILDKLHTELKEATFPKHPVQLEAPLKILGDHTVMIKLHSQVEAPLKVIIESPKGTGTVKNVASAQGSGSSKSSGSSHEDRG